MAAPTFTLIESIERQAASCAHIGSPLYAALLTGLAGDFLSGGITAELLEGVSAEPVHDAVPLRYLATAHRLALAGDAPELAECYPSCGGVWDGNDPSDRFLSVVAKHRGEFIRGLQRNVQTNEVGRAVVLAAGCSFLSERHGRPLRTFEIGSSAGLLSRWPHYAYDTGETRMGDRSSPVHFGPTWFEAPRPCLHPGIEVVDQAANDIAPIDVTTDEGRLTALSFLWPDQTERYERLDAAIGVAKHHPLRIDQGDAGEWLAARLTPPSPGDTTTVVFHAIVWQYLPSATKNTMTTALSAAGAAATPDTPLCWLRMEPATSEHADLRLTSWPGGRDEVLAHVGYHGASVRWKV